MKREAGEDKPLRLEHSGTAPAAVGLTIQVTRHCARFSLGKVPEEDEGKSEDRPESMVWCSPGWGEAGRRAFRRFPASSIVARSDENFLPRKQFS